ncbi:UNVERIFIED_CONTAM: hypothetical protein RMT77_013675 [Armadillidium vulgare]
MPATFRSLVLPPTTPSTTATHLTCSYSHPPHLKLTIFSIGIEVSYNKPKKILFLNSSPKSPTLTSLRTGTKEDLRLRCPSFTQHRTLQHFFFLRDLWDFLKAVWPFL